MQKNAFGHLERIRIRIRVAQIVGTWARRAEKVEEERENGRKWRERERKRECSTPLKYDSVLLRNIIFCHKMLKYGTFLS